jgi:DNA-binding MarR family transcriptional regulator
MNRIDQEAYVFGFVLLLANKLQIWGDGLLEEITIKQWFLLIIISNMSVKTPKIKEIADLSGTTRQNTKKILEQLEKKGFVKISKSNVDERALNVKLSNKTKKYFAENDKKAADSVKQLFINITDKELGITFTTLKKLLEIFGISGLNLEENNE